MRSESREGEARHTLWVAAYCRVSTDSADQAGSFENQKSYFESYIAAHKDWQLYRIYADAGVTGTSTEKRAAFRQMLSDAEKHSFDLILTKEVSRFARNTLDALQYTRLLKEKNIGVVFCLDNICSLDADAELRLTIMASLAQEESRKTSERVKWGQRRQMEKGVVFGRDLLGYRVENGKMRIEPTGAQTVRTIFHKYVREGKGACTIARELSASGVPTFSGNKQWQHSVVLKILENEKYCGDLVQKKTYTPNYLTHEKRKNDGVEPLICREKHHEPIIERALWQAAQERLQKSRKAVVPSGKSGRYPLSGKILCGFCGKTFAARTKIVQGTHIPSWQCRNAACMAPHVQIRQKDLDILLQKAFDALSIDRTAVLDLLEKSLQALRKKENDALYLSEEQKNVLLAKAQDYLTEIAGKSCFYRSLVESVRIYGREKAEIRFCFTDTLCTAYIGA